MVNITESEITLKPESSESMARLMDNLQVRFSTPIKDKKIISKTMYPVESADPIIQLEEVKEVMTLDYIPLKISNLEEIWDRNTWRDEPTIDISDTGQNDIPCLVFHDGKSTNLEKDRLLAIYTIHPGDDEKSVRLDRVFLSTQRKYKDQIIVDATWGIVKDTNMPQESLKSAIGIMKDLGYENIDIPETGKELKSRYALTGDELQEVLNSNVQSHDKATETLNLPQIDQTPSESETSTNLPEPDFNLEEEWEKDIERMDHISSLALDQVFTMENLIENVPSKESTDNRLNFIIHLASQIEKSQSLLDQVYSGFAVERLKKTINPAKKKLEESLAKIGDTYESASELPLLITRLENIDQNKLDNGLNILLPIILRKFYNSNQEGDTRIFYRRDKTAEPYIESSLKLLSFLKSTLIKSKNVEQTPAIIKIRSSIIGCLNQEFKGYNTLASDMSNLIPLNREPTTEEDRYLRWRQEILLETLDQLKTNEAMELYQTTLKNEFKININNQLLGNDLTKIVLNHIIDENDPNSPLLEVKKDIIFQVLNNKFPSTINQTITDKSEIGSNRIILQKIAKSLEDSLSKGSKTETIDVLPSILKNIRKVRNLVFHGGVLEAREDPIRNVLREFLIFTDFSQFDPSQYDNADFEELRNLKIDFMADILQVDKRFPITPHKDSRFGYSEYWYNKALDSIRKFNPYNSRVSQKVMA